MFIQTRGIGPSSERPALAMIHGWAMHGGLFAPLVDRLASRYTLHLVDLPGHGHARGDPTALDPQALATELARRIGPAVWLGWSLGGLIALRGALDHPTRVRGLVMLASSPRFVRAPDWAHGVDPALFGEFSQALSRDFRGTLQGFLALSTLGAAHARDELRDLRSQAGERGEPSAEALQQGLTLLDRLDLREELPRLAVPSLWISGRCDRVVSPLATLAAARLAPNARSVILDGAGHAPFFGAADAVAHEIEVFLKQVATIADAASAPVPADQPPSESPDPVVGWPGTASTHRDMP